MGAILAAALTLTNCTDQIETPVQQPESTGYPFEITASAVKTKTVNYNNSMSTEWAVDDQINLFHSDADAQEVTYINDGAFTIAEENLLEGRFTGELKEALSDDKSYNWYAFYPYTESFSTPGAKVKGYVNVGAKEQVQNGNSNMDHIAGTNFPLAGIANTEGTAKPVIEMSHLASLIKVHVTNKSSAPLTVTNVTFTGTEDIVGTYYINFVDMNSEEGVRYTSSGENYVTAAATLKVMEGASIPVDGTADFYLGIKPFGAKSGATISLQVNTCIKDVVLSRDVNFDAGTINTLNFSYVDPELPKGISAIKKEANADGASFAVTLEDAIVTYVLGSNAYIEDKEAGILIYTNNHDLMPGDKLSGDVTGTVKLYNNLREITVIDLSKAEKTSDNEIPVTTLTLAELNAEGAYDKYENMRIKIEDAEVAGNTITQAGETYEFYLKNASASGFDEYNIIDVIGYPTKFRDAIRFNVWEDAEVKGATKTTFIGFNDVEVVVGGTVANKATASSGATVKYVSDNTEVATVDNDGNVTGVAEGEATITASVDAYNGYPAAEKTCTVTVTAGGGEIVAGGGSSDFATVTKTNTSYGTSTTTAGWKTVNCAVLKGGSSDSNPMFKMIGDDSNRAFCMNGKTSAVGTITSPDLENGCGKISFNYGLPYNDTKIKFKVEIKQNDVPVKEFTVENNSATKLTKYSFDGEVNISGTFTIVFTNLSPSSNSNSNKDRTAIWDVTWTGYTE